MKRNKLKLLSTLAVGVVLGRGAQADTILTFDAAPPGQAFNEVPIPGFGDNAGSSRPGVDVLGFGTSGISLDFRGSGGATRWEYYIDGVWSAAQLNGSTIGSFHAIDFTPSPTAAVAIKSFNFHPYYLSSETYNYAWSVRAGATILASGTISFEADASKNHPVAVDYTGNLGQTLTLQVDRTGGSGSGQNIAVDDIRFAQLPEPAGPYVISSTPTAGQNPTSPDAPFDATLTNGVTQLAPGSIRLFLNGAMVAATITPLPESASVSFRPPALLPSGSSNKYSLVFADNAIPSRSYTNDVPFVVARYVNVQLPAPLYLETFDSVAEGSLPAGWTVQNFTTTQNPGADPNDVGSDFYLNWAVVSRSTVSNLGGVTPTYLSMFNVLPFQVVNSQVVTSLMDGNSILSVSDGRAGAQIRYLFTGDYDLSGRSDISISFHNIWAQNQDSIGAVEYSINGGATWLPALYLLDAADILRDDAGQIDAFNTLATVHADVADPATMQPLNGHYGAFVGVAREQWATLGPYLSGRVNDDTTESKRVEVIRLPQADNQPAVRFRFAHSGSDSWYFGIDNFGIYSGAVVPPLLTSVTPASRVDYIGATAILTANARGAIPIGYQWRKNGVNLPGQTGADLWLPNVQLSDAGDYTVVVTSSGLSITSSPPATLTVLSTPGCGVTEDLMVYLNFDNNIAGQGGTTINGSLMTGAERYVPGVIGQAASFRNDAGGGAPSDWAVTLGNQDALYAGNFTVALWLRTSVTGDGALTGNKDWNSGGNVGWLMDQYDVGYLNFRANGGDRYDLGPEIRDGFWHHLALSAHRETNGFILYLDGVPVAAGRIGPTGAESLGAGFDTLIGSSGPGAYGGYGDIDDYAIWTRALPTEEVACVFANALIGKGVSLLPSDPRLRFSLGPFGELNIFWGSVFAGYTLEASTTLGPDAVWNPVPDVINNSVTVIPGEGSRFYRLRRP